MHDIDIITLGCSKNLVDSEQLMGLFARNGFRVHHDPEKPKSPVVVINTCGFIEDAKQESIDTILQFAEAKDDGQIQCLYVMGCLSQRYRKELEAEIPQVDRYYGKFDFRQLAADLLRDANPAATACLCGHDRVLTTPPHYAYIKISEGCDRACAYCAIPVMTGRHRSRPQAEIVAEVRALVAQGVREFQIIAQELTYYGVDLDGQRHIAELIDALADIDGVQWLRLHYAYPNQFPLDLLDVMRRRPNVCRYLDIALQHISDPVLARMHRHITKAETLALLRQIRAAVPGIHLRTTLMVGFPGETEADFQELLAFVKEARFERMGAFAYSEEDGTYSAQHYADDVPQEEKQRRLDILMQAQQEISAEVEAEKVGQTLRVVVDRTEGDYYVCRSEFCSPEVDPEVLVSRDGAELEVGQFYNVKVTASDDFDLFATLS